MASEDELVNEVVDEVATESVEDTEPIVEVEQAADEQAADEQAADEAAADAREAADPGVDFSAEARAQKRQAAIKAIFEMNEAEIANARSIARELIQKATEVAEVSLKGGAEFVGEAQSRLSKALNDLTELIEDRKRARAESGVASDEGAEGGETTVDLEEVEVVEEAAEEAAVTEMAAEDTQATGEDEAVQGDEQVEAEEVEECVSTDEDVEDVEEA